MAISKCKRCDVNYWRYRRDFPPSGFCSLGCAEEKGKRFSIPADRPAIVLEKWRGHRIASHGDTHFIAFHDCDTCEWFEERYSESLGYYMDHPEPKPQEATA